MKRARNKNKKETLKMPRGLAYYPFVKNWQKIKKHLDDPAVQTALIENFNKFTFGRDRRKFTAGMLPEEFDSCDWRWEIRTKHPHYFRYVTHSACHWLVHFNLELAKLVEPKRQWRIVSSQSHSTVWDGEKTLFDFNFSALDVPVREAFVLAHKRGKRLKVGEHLETFLAEPNRKGKRK